MADDDWTPDFGTLDERHPPGPPSGRYASPSSATSAPAPRPAGSRPATTSRGARWFRSNSTPSRTPSAALGVKLALPIGDGGDGVEVEFSELDSFHPDSLYRELPMFKSLVDLRKRLNNTATFAKAAAEVQAMGGGSRRKACSQRPQAALGAVPPAADAKLSDFARLVGIAPEGACRCTGRCAAEARSSDRS